MAHGREEPSEVGAQRPQGESTMLEEREEQERKIKKTEERHECSLKPRHTHVLKRKNSALLNCTKEREIYDVWTKDTELTTDPSRQVHWRAHKTHHNGTSEPKCIRINCPDLIHRREEVVRGPRSWLHGKSKWPKQKELENLNLEEIPGKNIFSMSSQFLVTPHLGTWGPNLSVPEETFR